MTEHHGGAESVGESSPGRNLAGVLDDLRLAYLVPVSDHDVDGRVRQVLAAVPRRHPVTA